jgi:uncharacterized protein YndB with AHSA1/START domain
MSPSELASVTLERTFAGSPEEVFDAWTNPEVLERWWGIQPTWTSPGCEVDLRVGGRYVLRARDDGSGRVHVLTGEYREIDRPNRLVYTWCWEGGEDMHPGHVSLVTVEFRADGAATTVLLEHAQLASEESRAGHAAGWAGALDNLATRIFHMHDSQPQTEE